MQLPEPALARPRALLHALQIAEVDAPPVPSALGAVTLSFPLEGRKRVDLSVPLSSLRVGFRELEQPDRVRALVLPQTPDWDGAQRWLDGRDPKGLLRRPIYGQLALAALRRRRTERWYATALGDRTQAPSGAGFALENRVATSRVFADLFASSNVHRLAGFFQAFRDTLQALRKEDDSQVDRKSVV